MKRVLHPARLCALLLWALTIGSVGCSNPADRIELPALTQAPLYKGPWEYRYGDSPQRADGTYDWADPTHNDGKWLATTQLGNPPGRGSKKYLWLRTRIFGPPLKHGTVVLPSGVYQSLEAYVNGQLVTRFGPMDQAKEYYPGKRPIYLPLGSPLATNTAPGDEHPNWTLTLRFYSPTWEIGFLGAPLLGEKAPLLVFMVKHGLPFIVFGTICIVFGLSVLVLYAVDRRESIYAVYGLLCLFIGTYELARSPMRAFLFESPAIWRCTEVASLFLIAASMAAFFARLLDNWSRQLMRWLSWFFLFCFGIGIMLAVSGLCHLESILRVQLYLLVVFFLTSVAVTMVVAWRGNPDWRILAGGFLISAALAVYAALQSLSIIKQGFETRHYTAAVFEITLGIVLARRFRAFHKQLHDYSTVLQLSFSSSQDLTPGHQAQIALAELLRMLKAERGLLFLCRADGTELDLVAGRNSQGQVLHDPARQSNHDQRLVSAVLQKRRPFVRQFRRSSLQDGAPPKTGSAVAVPLFARGQLLGVIYLETSAARHVFSRQNVEILLGLGSQIALTLMATRAGNLESEGAQVRQRLAEQGALLEVAARLARGDLKDPVAVDKNSDLARLAEALDHMRLDLRAKIDQLESSHAAVRQLNEELRFQLDQRLGRLLDLALPAKPPGKELVTCITPGAALGQSYQVVSLLGQGRSGSVYEVVRIADGRHLAAKAFGSGTDKAQLLRFAREVQSLARINHPNVVSIIEVDFTFDAVLLLVMELVRGVPLSHCQNRYRNHQFVLPVLQQIAAGLGAVHERGMLHRDLKPANVLIVQPDSAPGVKLIDFGVSTLYERTASDYAGWPIEPHGLQLGTPMYLAPELAQGAQGATAAADVFSFGVIAYEFLTGEMPFAQPPILILGLPNAAPLKVPNLTSQCPELSPALAELINRCLNEELAQRPSAKDLLDLLNDLLRDPL